VEGGRQGRREDRARGPRGGEEGEGSCGSAPKGGAKGMRLDDRGRRERGLGERAPRDTLSESRAALWRQSGGSREGFGRHSGGSREGVGRESGGSREDWFWTPF
jgi:hypothetical protein